MNLNNLRIMFTHSEKKVYFNKILYRGDFIGTKKKSKEFEKYAFGSL